MKIQLIASDLDGTLLNRDGKLSKRTVNALKSAMEAGIYVVLASGRMIGSMTGLFHEIGANAPIIAFNGGMIYDCDRDTALYAREIPAEDARRVARLAEEMGVYMQGYTREGYFFETETKWSGMYARALGGIPGKALGMPLSKWIDRPMCKLLMIAEAAVTQGISEKFSDSFGGMVDFAISKPEYLECMAVGVQKGAALKRLAAHLGVPREAVLAFGDAENDVQMLDWAGYGYAVENARPEVRARALKAPSNDEDGVARVIEALLNG